MAQKSTAGCHSSSNEGIGADGKLRWSRAVFATLFVLFWPGFGVACECPDMPLGDRLRASDAVFLGEVIAPRPGDPWPGKYVVALRFKVLEPFTGQLPPELSARSGMSCDGLMPAWQKPGEHLLVFVRLRHGIATASRCLGTAPERDAAHDIEWLRLIAATSDREAHRQDGQ